MDSYTWLQVFALFFVFRYLRTVVSVAANCFYKPKPILPSPSYTSKDATVLIPTTFKSPSVLVDCLHAILRCRPAAVIIVTANANVSLVQSLCEKLQLPVTVLGVRKLNKRTQILKAIPFVCTGICVLADDDVYWPDDYLNYLLAVFEDPKVGAGGTRQRVRRNEKPDIWNFLGISYLERRSWNNITTNAIDGTISTLSGRTAAYRSAILQSAEFEYYFGNDSWRGQKLNSDDDKCLTRYIYSHGWKIAIQCDPRAVIETTVECGYAYLQQCMRWARAHWRGNLTVMNKESYWCSPVYLWGFYVIYLGQFQSPALVWDGMMIAFLLRSFQDGRTWLHWTCVGLLVAWIIFTKLIKLMPHFYRHPSDMKFIPLSITFSYFHGFLNIWAACTLNVRHWGSQKLEQLENARVESGYNTPLLREKVASVAALTEPEKGTLI